ncbi:2OG-Fe(II) oxygenase [Altererythrobacter sp. MF3-039]|uniref:2OG-Fe(II) oxygenase n=1 Tax=Altererythrobacter sp. MF3-039 TaxID=3252901 RepID=UPI00390C89E1
MRSPITDPLVEANALARAGKAVDAVEYLQKEIDGGNADAAAMLASWRLSGQIIRRDLAAVRELLGKASSLGCKEATAGFMALLANGAGGSGRRWQEALSLLSTEAKHDPMASREYELISDMKLDDQGHPREAATGQLVSNEFRIATIPDFLSKKECQFLHALADPLLRPATVGDPRTGRIVRDPVRRARSTGFPFVAERPFVHAINRRIAAATATSYEQGEPLQVISYQRGEEFRLHTDAVTHDTNQRIMTFLVTIEDNFAGGETEFPRIDLKFRGKLGQALFFHNLDDSGRANPKAWHAGLPVTNGRKAILSKWIRERPLDLSGPKGRPL